MLPWRVSYVGGCGCCDDWRGGHCNDGAQEALGAQRTRVAGVSFAAFVARFVILVVPQTSCAATLRAVAYINDESIKRQLRMIDAPDVVSDDAAWIRWTAKHSKRAPHFDLADQWAPEAVVDARESAAAPPTLAAESAAGGRTRGLEGAVVVVAPAATSVHDIVRRNAMQQGSVVGAGPAPVIPGKTAFRLEFVTNGDEGSDRTDAVVAAVASASGVPCQFLAHISSSATAHCICLCCDDGATLRLYNAARHGSLTKCCSGVDITVVDVPQHRVVRTSEISHGGALNGKGGGVTWKPSGAIEPLLSAHDAIGSFGDDAIVLLKEAFDASASVDVLPFSAVASVCRSVGYDVPSAVLQKRYSRTDVGLTFAQLIRALVHSRSQNRIGSGDVVAVGASVGALDAVFSRFARDGRVPAIDASAAVNAAGIHASAAEVRARAACVLIASDVVPGGGRNGYATNC